MSTTKRKAIRSATTVAETVRKRIDAGGERVWRFSDFDGLPFSAVAQALSRLTRLGTLQRLGKGMYFRPRETVFGLSKPNPARLRELSVERKKMFPSGLAAANLLGFTSQNPARVEMSTNGLSLPRQIVGKDTIIHTRRPESWQSLSETDAALLDFLRHRGVTSELSAEATVEKLIGYFRESGRFGRLLAIALSEPPRVQAMLGAIGQQLGKPASKLADLRRRLNSLSRFDFGILSALKYADEWQAKVRRSHEAV
jgi:hypothetical protein